MPMCFTNNHKNTYETALFKFIIITQSSLSRNFMLISVKLMPFQYLDFNDIEVLKGSQTTRECEKLRSVALKCFRRFKPYVAANYAAPPFLIRQTANIYQRH